MKNDYIILGASTTDELSKRVNEYREKGYRCIGGVAIHSHHSGVHFYQSMEK